MLFSLFLLTVTFECTEVSEQPCVLAQHNARRSFFWPQCSVYVAEHSIAFPSSQFHDGFAADPVDVEGGSSSGSQGVR